MLVFINGRFLTQKLTGVQRYAREVVNALDNVVWEYPRVKCTLLMPPGVSALPLTHIEALNVGRLRGNLWEQLELPRRARGGLLLNLCNAAPLTARPQIVTVHDMAVFSAPGAFTRTFRIWYRFMLRRAGDSAAAVMTVSRFSANEICKYMRVPAEKVRPIYNGIDHMQRLASDGSVLERRGLQKERYILAVGGGNPNKNLPAVAEAARFMSRPDYPVVLAGGTDPRVFRGMDVTGLRCLGRVSDEELKAFYENAACFVFPSLYEGFGLPPLEAMACGCPAVVSDAASLPEICGDAALYCDPQNTRDLAGKICRVLDDKELRESLRLRGLQRAKEFTWTECARKILGLIVEVMDDGQ